mmetsp:Transcript_16790/g.28062  ORF Transcript_16790/g.28062 Transcript_16790/m.28062 type:complete len:206 (+) Transcript_16790:585-1202(+)
MSSIFTISSSRSFQSCFCSSCCACCNNDTPLTPPIPPSLFSPRSEGNLFRKASAAEVGDMATRLDFSNRERRKASTDIMHCRKHCCKGLLQKPLESLSLLEVEMHCFSKDMLKLRVGDSATLTLDLLAATTCKLEINIFLVAWDTVRGCICNSAACCASGLSAAGCRCWSDTMKPPSSLGLRASASRTSNIRRQNWSCCTRLQCS